MMAKSVMSDILKELDNIYDKRQEGATTSALDEIVDRVETNPMVHPVDHEAVESAEDHTPIVLEIEDDEAPDVISDSNFKRDNQAIDSNQDISMGQLDTSEINSCKPQEMQLGASVSCSLNRTKCSVCQTVDISNPKLLICLHTICGNCLTQAAVTEVPGSQEKHIQCLICSRKSHPDQVIDNLFFDVDGKDLGTAVGSNSHVCTSCSDKAPGIQFCRDCNEWLCTNCVEAHQRVKFTKDHVLNDVASSRIDKCASKTLHCNIHKQELLSVYCESCEKQTCRVCQLADHRNHKYKFADEIYENTRNRIKAALEDTRKKQNMFYDAKKNIDAHIELISTKRSEVDREIQDFIKGIMNAVKNRGGLLLKSLNEACSHKSESFKVWQDRISLLIKQTDHAADFIESALQSNNNMALLYTAHAISQQSSYLMKCGNQMPLIKNTEILLMKESNNALFSGIANAGHLMVDGKIFPPQSQQPLVKMNAAPNVVAIRPAQNIPQSRPQPLQYMANIANNWSRPYPSNSSPRPIQSNIRLPTDGNHPGSYFGISNPMPGNRVVAVSSTNSPRTVVNPTYTMKPAFRTSVPQANVRPNVNNALQPVTISPLPQASNIGVSKTAVGLSNGVVNVSTDPNQVSISSVDPSISKPILLQQLSTPSLGMLPVNQNKMRISGLISHRQSSPSHSRRPPLQPIAPKPPPMPSHGSTTWHIPQAALSTMIPNSSQAKQLQDDDGSFKIRIGPNLNNEVISKGEGIRLGDSVMSTQASSFQGPVSAVPSVTAPNFNRNQEKRSRNQVENLTQPVTEDPCKDATSNLPVISSVYSEVENDGRNSQYAGSDLERGSARREEDPNEDWCAVCQDGGDLVCCDSCPKVFHLTCHVPVLQSFPQGEETWQCTLCMGKDIINKLPGPNNNAKRKKSMGLTPKERKVAESILLELYMKEDSGPFREMVDPCFEDYYKAIKHPIALDVIKSKLSPNCDEPYMQLQDFFEDINRMFKNCYEFNSLDSDVYIAGKKLEIYFRDITVKWLKFSGIEVPSESMCEVGKKKRKIDSPIVIK